MTTDIVVQTTIDFIRSSAENVALAKSVEQAMPRIREHVYGLVMGRVLNLLEKRKGHWHIAQHFPRKNTKTGPPHQLEGIRLYQKKGWTRLDDWGGVWFWNGDRLFSVGVEGFQNDEEPERTANAIESAFRPFPEFGDACAVHRQHDNQVSWRGFPEDRLFSMPDTGEGSLEAFAEKVAEQMLDLTRTISETKTR